MGLHLCWRQERASEFLNENLFSWTGRRLQPVPLPASGHAEHTRVAPWQPQRSFVSCRYEGVKAGAWNETPLT